MPIERLLKGHTHALRTLAAVCRGTRRLVTERFPDTVRLWDEWVERDVPFHFDARRDVLLIEEFGRDEGRLFGGATQEPGCTAVRKIAIAEFAWGDAEDNEIAIRFFASKKAFPSLAEVYEYRGGEELLERQRPWVGSRHVHTSQLR